MKYICIISAFLILFVLIYNYIEYNTRHTYSVSVGRHYKVEDENSILSDKDLEYMLGVSNTNQFEAETQKGITNCCIIGGDKNISSGQYSIICGGYNNNITLTQYVIIKSGYYNENKNYGE